MSKRPKVVLFQLFLSAMFALIIPLDDLLPIYVSFVIVVLFVIVSFFTGLEFAKTITGNNFPDIINGVMWLFPSSFATGIFLLAIALLAK